jgi:hypothetical protein
VIEELTNQMDVEDCCRQLLQDQSANFFCRHNPLSGHIKLCEFLGSQKVISESRIVSD